MSITKFDLKIYLTKDNIQTENFYEIRKCSLQFLNGVIDFYKLYDKIETLFPDTKGQHFTIAWKDSDKDYITMSSTEELVIALFEMTNVTCNLYVTLHTDKKQKSQTPTENFNSQNNPKTKHNDIICDVCDKDIIGFRYKCLQCLDYDLCSDCERKNHHAEHCLLRLPIAIRFEVNHGRKLLSHINKFIKRASSSFPEEESKELPFMNSHKNTYSHHHRRSSSWIDTFSTHLQDWANLIGEIPEMKQGKKNETNFNTNFCSPDTPETNINVPNGSENFSEGANANKEKNSEINVHEEFLNNAKQSMCEEITNSLQNEIEPTVRIDNDSKVDDWIVIAEENDLSDIISKHDSNKETMNSIIQDSTASSNEKMKYPDLPKTSENIWHENPLIQSSVEIMMQMGFTNENGWLTKLLVLKNGNINLAVNEIFSNSI